MIILVKKHHQKNWGLVEQEMIPDANGNMQSSKQCRERWFNVIKPIIENHLPIDEDRELTLFLLYSKEEYKNKWSKIAKHLGKTTDYCVKNHYYSVIKKELRHLWKMKKHNFPNPYLFKIKELNIELIDRLLTEYDIGIDKLENHNIALLICIERGYSTLFPAKKEFPISESIIAEDTNSVEGIPSHLDDHIAESLNVKSIEINPVQLIDIWNNFNESNSEIKPNSFRIKHPKIPKPSLLDPSKFSDDYDKLLFIPSPISIFPMNPELIQFPFNDSNFLPSFWQGNSNNNFSNDLEILINTFNSCQHS